MPLIRMEGAAPILESRGARILFDSAEGEGLRCLSHAHMDHAGSPGALNIMTGETQRIFASRKRYYRKYLQSPLGVKITPQEGVSLTALNSGHMLGSSMFKLEADGLSILYTGDMNVYDSILQRGAEQHEAEVLIIESTYGSPIYRFPNREEIYYQIIKWAARTLAAGEIPALKAYSAGKAQEIMALINEALRVPVLVAPEVYEVSKVYKSTYRWLDFLRVGTREGEEVAKNGAVYISPQRDILKLAERRVRWALATGWVLTRRQEGYDAYFPLSAHSDFQGLFSYAKNSNYKTILTIYGFSSTLAKHLRRLGINAYSLEEKTQIKL
ncbi:MAG: MBL fold metallo-hydrolase [Nitrososphaerota archaeon]|nr:MBL fold metallo-hydrolase [Nitrososphaerota archaeon]